MALLPVEDALARVLDSARPLSEELVPLHEASGRALSKPLIARRTHPPFNASAMDGYAVRSSDVANTPVDLELVGTAAAGAAFSGRVHGGQAARIFTGAPLPDGADTVVIQENTRRIDEKTVRIDQPSPLGKHIRDRGLDFAEGDVLLDAGRVLDPAALSLAAAGNHPELFVWKRPLVALIATGDELLSPGSDPGPNQIISSNAYGVAAIVSNAGGKVLDLGIARDDVSAIRSMISNSINAGADIVVTLGGASVGDHDLVNRALTELGLDHSFWKIAMRPGKPLMFGKLEQTRCLGLPGNPVSSLICAHLFLKPLVLAMAGLPLSNDERQAVLDKQLPANDDRQDYIRACIEERSGILHAQPLTVQDSSMLRMMAIANAVIVREPGAPQANPGDGCRVLTLR